MALTYLQVLTKIKAALTLRPAGTLVQVTEHQKAEIAILDYIQQLYNTTPSTAFRAAHSTTAAGVNCDLTWNTPFSDTDYDFSVTGFNANGNPVEIKLIGVATDKIIIKTLEIASVKAIALSL